ncbi:carbohydrate binding family 9 domain-containing protein [Chryseolinea lacunae]|uniref:Carbohydrate binding family 9 domain-containing protein n=1 Tax=Chryseolinea lacunae TaxID=2801331 RepID=A0ABS1KVS9_9BACT|nr:carbohydrate binding family 9 domain-containing protein [Chryseolinea lacunae]MBL0743560.1 carbohydrate binding family 9 domain-containing protein [Chryseolinea lacunae]
MKPFYCLVLLSLWLAPSRAWSHQQPTQPTTQVLTANRTPSLLKIDGVLEEEWNAAPATGPFTNQWPLDSGFAEARTEVKVLFNDQFLYVSAVNYQRREDLIIQSLKRDQLEPFWRSDGFAILVDPLRQKSTGFLFGVNAGGAQLDGAVTQTSAWSQTNENWDNKWFSAVKVYDDYWIAEMAIPFTALRFKEGADGWGLNFIRNDMKRNVFATWSPVPVQLAGTDLAHLGTLQWGQPLHPVRSRVTLVPYMAGGHSRNHEEGEPAKTRGDVGLDAKVSLTSSLNLDLTLRPDFSNVEVDRQMTNVTRFSLLYPERRNFFLENADLFANFGSWNVKPFFSRTIGLHDGDPVPIAAGARLSGNLTNSLRIGLMDVQTETTDEVSANNYFVATVQQRVLARSVIKALVTNRQTTRATGGDTQLDYNRTLGGEFQYTAPKASFNVYLRAHTAQTPEKLSENNYISTQVSYLTKKYYGGLMLEKVGENYVNDLSFIPRLHNYDAARDTTVRIGHYTVNPWFGWLIYPKNSKTNIIELNTWSVINFRSDGSFLERYTSLNVSFAFKDTRKLYVEATNNEVNLPFPSDILDNDQPIPVEHYNFTQYSARYTTDTRKAFNGSVNASFGNFYNGTRLEYGMTLNFRSQPWGLFGVSFLQNDIRLPEAYGKAQFTLVGPRAEVSLRNNLWWTTFLQYNTQAGNFNINSRVQWRFKPMSDIFVVYTDNYATTDMRVKNKGVVFKLTYWLNL